MNGTRVFSSSASSFARMKSLKNFLFDTDFGGIQPYFLSSTVHFGFANDEALWARVLTGQSQNTISEISTRNSALTFNCTSDSVRLGARDAAATNLCALFSADGAGCRDSRIGCH